MTEIPWRDNIAPARLMDTHEVPLVGGPDDPTIEDLERLLLSGEPTGLAWPARVLFLTRDWLGRLFGWDGEKEKPTVPKGSFYWKMSEEDKQASLRRPGDRLGPALILWNDPYSLCLEVLNATCQAFAVGYVRDRKAYLSVFVIETKWWSKYYLAAIEPFRKYIVYPAGVKWVRETWQRHYDDR